VQTAFVFCCDGFVSVSERALGGGGLMDNIGNFNTGSLYQFKLNTPKLPLSLVCDSWPPV
jgi:hypothetical protein